MTPQAIPFGCSELEARVMDLFVKVGTLQAVAIELRIDEAAVQQAIYRVRARMRVGHRVLAALKWKEARDQQAAQVAQDPKTRTAAPCPRCAGLGFVIGGKA